MTDKEIIIDGVDVSGCEFYMHYDYGKFSHGCSMHKDMFGLPVCCDIADCCKDCYFKQLARKTQECEELKQRFKCNCFDAKSNNNRCISYNRIAEDYERDLKRLENKIAECEKYKQALDEFELLITNHISSCEKCPDNKNGYCIGIDECSSRCLKKILDIINKAKGEIMEIK